MTFGLYELSLNPDIQEKLRDDIREVLAKHDNKLTYEAMLDMKYLQMVIDGEKYSRKFLKHFINISKYFIHRNAQNVSTR